MVDQYCLYIALFSCSFAALAYLYKIIRIYGKIEVNCWFCNCNTKVKYKLSNSFICPFCDQYNGFREDGDYNCIIPAQHSENYNFSVQQKFQRTSVDKDKTKFDNEFCDSCNLNQALKIRALAEFSSFSSDDNDEIEKFQERLEEIYGLCQQCQAILHQTLGKQNSWLKPQLISWKLLQSRKKSVKALVRDSKSSSWKILHVLSLSICLSLSLLSLEKYSPDLLQPLKTSFELNFIKFDTTYSLLIYLGLILQILLVLLFSNKLISVRNLASFVGWCLLYLLGKCNSLLYPDDIEHLQCVANVLNLFFIAWITRIMFPDSFPAHRTKDRSKKRNVERNLGFCTGPVRVSDSLNMSPAFIPERFSEDAPKRNGQNDLDADLLSLKISTPKKNSGTFSPQNLFRDTASEKGRSSYRNVVQPSKFGKHFITQASWVAGGYWGSPGSPQRGRLTSQNVSHLDGEHPNPAFSASRSSSQSSGFVSQMSECASSRSQQNTFQNGSKYSHSQQSSLFGDPADRGSVYSCNRTPINHTSSFSTLGHQNLDSFEAHSACSASSFLSDNSRVPQRLSSHGPFFRDTNPPSPISDILPLDTADGCPNLINMGYITTSYFNLGIAFILGLSVSANIFLVIILSHYNITFK